jgi:dCMP deaminase
MTRRSREAVLMDTAHVFASRSTCSRAQVGAVIARDGRIIVTGYNGAPSGLPHCDHTCTCPKESPVYEVPWVQRPEGGFHRPEGCPEVDPCITATHAEANAVAFAARHGVATEEAELFVTMAPCIACARIVVNAGLSTVYYDTPYRDMSGAELLLKAGLRVHDPKGWLTLP